MQTGKQDEHTSGVWKIPRIVMTIKLLVLHKLFPRIFPQQLQQWAAMVVRPKFWETER